VKTSLDSSLISVWRQAMVVNAHAVVLGTEHYPVTSSKAKRLRQVAFVFDGNEIMGVEQNPETKPRWSAMARAGKKVMQFIQDGRYVAVVAGGKTTLYRKRALTEPSPYLLLATATYTYDAIGHRVEKAYPGGGYQDYLYDLAGNVEGEWLTSSGYTGALAKYGYMNGALTAEYYAGTTYFIHKDHLGSTRLVTGVTQSVVDNMDYLPFGEQTTGGSSTTHKFTSKERDSETNLDNFGASIAHLHSAGSQAPILYT
jgi:hypothetical protein